MSISPVVLFSILGDILAWIRHLGIEDILNIGAGIFSLLLFLLSTYAWWRRRQPSLIIVAVAFFLFFLNSIIAILPVGETITNSVGSLLDVIILALFFVAVVVRPRRRIKVAV